MSEALWVILAAAGRGLRLDSDTPKQYLPLGGSCAAERCLELLVNFQPPATAIIVASAAEDMRRWADFAASADARVRVIEGGSRRADSVAAALRALAERAADSDWVLVHDAARPCLRAEHIRRLHEAVADDAIGGLLAVPLTDMLHAVSGERLQAAPQGRYWRAQTPQMFRYAPLCEALRDMDADNPPRDEAQAMLASGHAPKVVMGSPDNIKITHRDDLPLAEAMLAASSR